MKAEEILIYLRKSRSDNPEETVEEVLARHERQLQEHAVRSYGLPVPEQNIYREIVSGETIDARPEVKKVLARIEDPDIKGVLIIEPQRLSRGDWEDGGKILSSFRYSYTLIITPHKTYDLQDKFDYKFFKMELSQGNDYLEYTKEILNRGKLASVKEGNYIGSVAPFGYQKAFINKSPTLVPDPIEAPAIELIFDLFVRKDLGWTKTARALDQMGIAPRRSHYWNPSQIKTILTNPVYTGKVTWNHCKSITVVENGKLRKSRPIAKDYMIIDGKHPALISEELFQKAQEKLGRNTREPFSKELVNPLAGLLYCKNCGTAMIRRTYRQPDGSARSVPRLLCNNQSHCGTKSATFDSVYSALLLALRNTIQDFHIKIQQDDTLSAYTAQQRILATLEAELARLESRQEELYDLLEDGIYSKEVFLKRNEKLAESRSELEAKIKKAKENAPRPINYQDRIIKFEQVLQALQDDAVPPKEKNRLLKQIIQRIDYSRDSTNRTRWDTSKPVLEIHFKEF